MTIDDENSVYVGGLPYDANEDTIRRVFSIYGAVVAVKIINDHSTRGKCYGFVTFTNPQSAIDAINDMNGRTINGRIVKVNEVTARGGRSDFNRDRSRRNEWDRGRDRERDHDRDRDRYGDRFSDRSGERDRDYDAGRERGYRHHNHDRAMNTFLDRDQERDVEDNVFLDSKEQSRDWERDQGLNLDHDREVDGTNGYHRSFNGENDQQLRGLNQSVTNDQHSRGLSSDSSGNYNQVKEQLKRSIERQENLKKEISQMEGRLEERQRLVLDLQKKSKALEDTLITAKKLSSQRRMQLTKLHTCFLQVMEYKEKLNSSERELQSLVDSALLETADDSASRGGARANGFA